MLYSICVGAKDNFSPDIAYGVHSIDFLMKFSLSHNSSVDHDVLDVDLMGINLTAEGDRGACDRTVGGDGDRARGGKQGGIKPVVRHGAGTDVGLAEFHQPADFLDVFGSQG